MISRITIAKQEHIMIARERMKRLEEQEFGLPFTVTVSQS